MASSFTFLSSIISFVCKASVSQRARCQIGTKSSSLFLNAVGPKYNRGPIYIKEWQNLFTHYACTFLTHSSLSADRFHTKTSGRFTFTWYCCKISYRSEILSPVQQLGWTQANVTHMGMTFCGGII